MKLLPHFRIPRKKILWPGERLVREITRKSIKRQRFVAIVVVGIGRRDGGDGDLGGNGRREGDALAGRKIGGAPWGVGLQGGEELEANVRSWE